MSRIDNMAIAQENRQIVKTGAYQTGKKRIPLKLTNNEVTEVEVFSPERIEKIVEIYKVMKANDHESLTISVRNCDSFSAAKLLYDSGKQNALVMNFANAIRPGGGYLSGANAQEECLCRQSTLYASISSKKAEEMYSFNDKKRLPFDSDYMLLSKFVEVFRDPDGNLLDNSFTTSVMTIPAPNLFGRAADASEEEVDKIMKHRIRNYFTVAIEFGYRHLVLGAWGCGAFGHNAKNVARYFREVLFDEGYSDFFSTIVFAVLDTTFTRYNYHSFLETFSTQYAF
ncbi:MAG: TIGR02452 family protein [bacterium]|nr:TIGR02452 family protein [bacterium]